MKWQQIVYKIGQLFGVAATATIAIGLSVGWFYEPNLLVKSFEVIGSFIAAGIIGADVLDLTPEFD
jgi:hypothetical protein